MKIAIATNDPENIERTMACHEQMMIGAAQRFGVGVKIGSFAIACVEFVERLHETFNVGQSTIGNDVEIERRNRGALDYCGNAADQHETDSVATQGREDRGKVSRLWRHGGTRSPD